MNIDGFLQTLPIMAEGMLSIFAVTAVMILVIFGLNKLSKKKDDK